MDNFSREKRSYVMSRVPRAGTEPEHIVRKFLFSHGFRYRVNVKKLPGSPDIVLSKYKTVIFIHGCFWHGHTCKYAALPTSNETFWFDKIAKNKERDATKNSLLREAGWHVVVVWQCELKNTEIRKRRLELLLEQIRSVQNQVDYE